MGIYTIKMPDVGEGVAEAEIVELCVPVGDVVREDEVFAAVMTDKATIEIPSSVSGTIIEYAGEVGDTVPVGSPLVRIEVQGEGNDNSSQTTDGERIDIAPAPEPEVITDVQTEEEVKPSTLENLETGKKSEAQSVGTLRAEGEKFLTSPAVRKRAKDAGIDLRLVPGSGPAGRITHDDLDMYFANDRKTISEPHGRMKNHDVSEVKVIGMRRKIAERMSEANTHIPHITIVEEIDVTSLEELRQKLNTEHGEDKPRLTILPFLMGAMVSAIKEQPDMNAHYDDEANLIRQFGATHIGIATQTPKGLMVPVVHHCEAMNIWQMAAELTRVAEAARNGSASREELSGSTISITSLGKLGAIATTPIINRPELAIIGVNRIAVRPAWNGSEFLPRQMMNLSCSFDHRIIDGWDAAVFVQRLKSLLETPAMIFVEG
ncbi:dihydrolipoamide acetyltransferase family protein [Lentilitoribacter sp. EG35]|uniref:dihydrolipoamide acetyltransferase family protein n=1 Tax=Lentilitoribacter sp. EG35 TaxID=3234192 RepID=UPI0034602198